MSKIYETTNYDKFEKSDINRSVTRHAALVKSMRAHGFLNYPILVQRSEVNPNRFIVLDGQHRLAIASDEGLPVKYVIHEGNGVSIAELNNAQKRWSSNDYLSSWCSQGKPEYAKLKAFIEKYGITIGAAVTLFTSFASGDGGNLSRSGFRDGKIKLRNVDNAIRVGEFVLAASKSITFARNQCFVLSVARCFLVKEFNPSRLLLALERSASSIHVQANIACFLAMFEEIYNKGISNKLPLKFYAENAVREIAEKNKPKSSKNKQEKLDL